jgi:hypothetical protein
MKATPLLRGITTMKKEILVIVSLLMGCLIAATVRAQEVRRISVNEYVDKMKAGWIGQMCGVGWGGPTEFRYRGELIPPEKMPEWQPKLVNQFHQDDIYVEMTFMRSLELYGLDVPIRQAGIDFANSGYRLWHANNAGRTNLRNGIAPPDSGHPQFNKHADDIDYQIEADYSGLIAPGMPNLVIELGEKFGRLMNYGDGVYAGQFVGGMYAEAFFCDDMVEITKAGLACIPAESQYAEMVRDVLGWYEKNPDDWKQTWEWIEEKYHRDPQYSHGLCSGPGGKDDFSIDAKLNGAYILMGLLYGKGDLDQTIVISTQCGQDSDCNPANSAGILFTTVGFSKLPERFTSALDPAGKFSHTPYDFPTLVEVSKKIVRQAVQRSGGKIETDADGEEVFVIPVREPQPGKLEQSRDPGPIADSNFTDEEMSKIVFTSDMVRAVEKFAPGWKVSNCGEDMDPGLRSEWGGREKVLVTHPLNREVPCRLTRRVDVKPGMKLHLEVAHDPRGDWLLVVTADGEPLEERVISDETASGGWLTVDVDLSEFAGKTVTLQLENCADDWQWEAGYWSAIELVMP